MIGHELKLRWIPTWGNGVHNFKVRAIDRAGNIGAWSNTITVKIDTSPPTGSITISGGAVYANSTSVTLTLSASDLSGVAQMRFSNDGSSWSSWYSYSTSASWTLVGGDGTKTVYVQFKDNAGLVSSSYSDTIILDTTAPTGSETINAGATYATSTTATLTLTYSDATSGVSQVRYSNDGVWDTEPWESPSGTKAWTLTLGDVVSNEALNNEDAKFLMTMPGIGFYLALLIVSEIGDVNRFPDSHHLVAYAGLAPSTHSSGGRTYHGRIMKTGSPYLRWILNQCVRANLRSDPDGRLATFYVRLAKKKGDAKAVVATSAKMLRIIYWMLREKQPYHG